MADLIDRHAAIDAFFNATADGDKVDFCVWVIQNVPSAQQWIPCSSGRLPETNGYYLTTTAYGEVYCDYWNGVNFDRTEMVIAWMPLPEPWKGGDL